MIAQTNNYVNIAPCETISKVVFRINNDLHLKMKVNIGRKDGHGYRQRFAKSYMYSSSKYKNIGTVSCIQMETDDYLILETYMSFAARNAMNVDSFKSKQFLLSYQNLMEFETALKTAYSWLFADGVYVIDKDDNNAIRGISPMYANLCIEANGRSFKGFTEPVLRFIPTVLTRNDERIKGIGVVLASGEQISSFTANEISALMYFLSHFDLCTASMVLTNQALHIMSMDRQKKVLDHA